MNRILIIDADKRLRGTYAQALEAQGHDVAQVAGAQAAIGACEDHAPDLIVLELQLQGHSGVEFLQEMRSYPEWNHIPVLLHTLVPRESLQGFDAAFKTYGIIGYAYKPETSLAKLSDLVDQALKINA